MVKYNKKGSIKYMKKNLIMLLIIIILISMNGCAPQNKVIESDQYFEYYLDNDDQYVIAGFTEEGKQQIELTIPETFNGKKIKRIGSYFYNNLESEKLERIYFYHVIHVEAEDFKLCPNFKKLMYLGKEPFPTKCIPGVYPLLCMMGHQKVPVYYLLEEITYINENSPYLHNSLTIPSNVVFYDGYTGKVIYIHYFRNIVIGDNYVIPTREGYLFTGWYKEPECINLFDVENEIVPGNKSGVDENNIQSIIITPLKLYAGWEKIEQ